MPAALPTKPSITPAETADHGPGIEAVAAIVGDRWSMLIVRNVFRGIRRFDALHDDLGVSRPVLAGRLKRLVEAGILERTRYQDHPPRYDYVLTPGRPRALPRARRADPLGRPVVRR